MTQRPLAVLLFCAAVICLSSAARAQDVRFNRDVRPILNQHCVECHGGVKQAGELSFAYEDQLRKVIDAAKPLSSLLLEKVNASDDERMPPADHAPRLSKEKIVILQKWIEQGARYEKHWAFEPPLRASTPVVRDLKWSQQPVDAFILKELESAGLTPSPQAAPDHWQRRVSLDLIGLPPTPAEHDAFLAQVAQHGEAAYAAEVDRLLASQHYGERWAAVWLDLVRYADSKGLGQDGRRTIWKYRDWVIGALNDDMPYDQFTVKQLAGDLLPQPELQDLLATACHRLTQTNEEGGTDDEQFRMEAVIDRVNTTWQVWNGLTFGCVQCHSHPYEPIRHEEYYRFAACFNNTADTDLNSDAPSLKVPINDADFARAMELDQQIAALELADWKASRALLDNVSLWQPLNKLKASTSNETQVQVVEREGHTEYETVGTVAKNTTIRLEAPLPAGLQQLAAIQFTGFPHDPVLALKDSEWGFVITRFQAELIPPDGAAVPLSVTYVIADEPEPLSDPQASLGQRSRTGFGAYSRINQPHRGAFVLAAPIKVVEGSSVRVSMGFDITETGAFPLVAKRGRLAVSSDGAFADWLNAPARAAELAKKAELEAARGRIRSVDIPIMRERWSDFSRQTFVFERGNMFTKGEQVTPGVPKLLHAKDDITNRLDMARWLMSEENPLVARVIVNRLWAQVFGIGIVETQEDFGSSGEPPSHPALLDDLAVRFRTDMNWKWKTLLRELVLSSTYRQSSRVTPELIAKDPRNRLLSRGPRVRLPAETVRDQALAISGLLNNKLYGAPVFPPLPDGVWKPFQSDDRWTTANVGSPDRYRRSLYTYTKRTIPFPMMATFDAPSREFCAPRRLGSNTPLQALAVLNDEAMHEAAQAFAKRMFAAGPDPMSQLKFGLELATSRNATEREIQLLRELYEKTLEQRRSTGDPTDSARLAALTNVGSVLLNLDEVLCK